MIIKKVAYQRVRTRSERTERNFLALIEVVVDVAFRSVLVLAVVEVFHDRVLHLLLHVQGLKQIKTIMKTIVVKRENSPHPGEGRFT